MSNKVVGYSIDVTIHYFAQNADMNYVTKNLEEGILPENILGYQYTSCSYEPKKYLNINDRGAFKYRVYRDEFVHIATVKNTWFKRLIRYLYGLVK